MCEEANSLPKSKIAIDELLKASPKCGTAELADWMGWFL
jgi:hypothetical protein